MGVIAVIAMAFVAWCACALVVGVVIGRALASAGRSEDVVPRPASRAQPTSTLR